MGEIMSTTYIDGDWSITKGKLMEKWASLTEDDLKFVEGQHDELYERIQKRTRASLAAVQKVVRDAAVYSP
jgi:uncharacterized protein YjbJ (UPF0337 family)